MDNYEKLNDYINKLGNISISLHGVDTSWLKADVWEPVLKRLEDQGNVTNIMSR